MRVLVLVLLGTGCNVSKVAIKPGLPSGQPPEHPEATVGRDLVVRLDAPVGTDLSRPGDRVRAHVAAPLVGRGGRILIPDGAPVEGHVTHAENGHGVTPPRLEVVFDRIIVDGRILAINGVVASADLELKSAGADPEIAGRGRYSGAVIGLIFLGLPGAVIGYTVGGVGGGIKAIGDRAASLRLQSGSFLTLRLLQVSPEKKKPLAVTDEGLGFATAPTIRRGAPSAPPRRPAAAAGSGSPPPPAPLR